MVQRGSRADLVHARGVHQPGGGQAQGLATAAWPPGERQGRVEQGERRLEQRQRRIAAGHHDGRPRRPDGPYRHQVPRFVLARPTRPPEPAEARHQPAGRAEAQPGGRVRVQWQRDERVADGGERDPGTRAVDRRHRLRQHRIAEITGAEQLLDRHAEGLGQAEGDAQRRIGMAGLDGGHRLPGDAGHACQLLLGQAASLPGQPQPRPVQLGDLRMSPPPLPGVSVLYPKARRARTGPVTGWLPARPPRSGPVADNAL